MNEGHEDNNPEIQRLQTLLSAGTITQDEYNTFRTRTQYVRQESGSFRPSAGIAFKHQFSAGQLTGFVGSALLFIGCFLPLVHLPIVGAINYIYNGRGDGMLVIALAVGCAILTALKNFRWLAVATLAAAAVCVFTFIRFAMLLADLHSSMERDLNDNPFRGIADAMVNSVSLDWAWGILLMGIGLLVASAIIMMGEQA